jgi:hypothetical protein
MKHALSRDLPSFLQHNLPDAVRVGDFVLPLFLFTSGLALGLKRNHFSLLGLQNVTKRLGRLSLLAIPLSPWTAGRFLGMDEIILNLLLFLPSYFLTSLSVMMISVCSLSTFMLYFLLRGSDLLPDFTEAYLGGYGAAIF